MKISELKELSNEDLLDVLMLYTRVYHYDPNDTHFTVVALRKEGVSIEDVEAIVLERMNSNKE